MIKFTPHIERTHPIGVGTQRIYKFPNNYGASVVRTPYTYGGDEGKFELAVLLFNGGDWHITYSTPITEDVLGYLAPEEVDAHLLQIAALPAAKEES